MGKWYRMPPTFRVTEREYRANIEGINIVFGAVLGFVLARADGLPIYDFMSLLFLSALVVILILYLGSSEYRLFYGVSAAGSIAALPMITTSGLKIQTVPYLQPTLAVWAFMVLLVELLPREPESKSEAEPGPDPDKNKTQETPQ